MCSASVKNGTPVMGAHLCRSCTHGQFTTGYRDSDVLVICTNTSPSQLVPFPVEECTEYWDRNRPSWNEMERLALSFSEGHRKPVSGFRGRGLGRALEIANNESDDEEEAAQRG